MSPIQFGKWVVDGILTCVDCGRRDTQDKAHGRQKIEGQNAAWHWDVIKCRHCGHETETTKRKIWFRGSDD